MNLKAIVTALFAACVVACSPPDGSPTNAYKPTLPALRDVTPPQASWQPSTGAPVISQITTPQPGMQIVFGAGGGTVSTFFEGARVYGGQIGAARFRASATQSTPIRVVFIRHCGDGPDFESQNVTLTSAPQDVDVSHRFTHAYACTRIDVVATGPATIVLTPARLWLAPDELR